MCLCVCVCLCSLCLFTWYRSAGMCGYIHVPQYLHGAQRTASSICRQDDGAVHFCACQANWPSTFQRFSCLFLPSHSRSTRIADVHPASSKCWGSKPWSSLLPISEPSPQREKTFSSHVAYDEKNADRRYLQCRPEVNYMGRDRFISQYWGLRIFNQQCGLIVFKYGMRNIIPFIFKQEEECLAFYLILI